MTKKTEKKPDGKKAHLENPVYKVGRIRYNSWATKVLKACDIVIYERELVHIQTSHGKELDLLGMTAMDFVKFILANFNAIYKGKEGRKIIAVERLTSSYYSVIELSFENNNYKIKTALSVKTVRLSKWKLLLTNIAH